MNEHDQPAYRKWPFQNKKLKTLILISHFRPKISKKVRFQSKKVEKFRILNRNCQKTYHFDRKFRKNLTFRARKRPFFYLNTHFNGPKMNDLSAARLNFSFKKIILISKIILVIKGQSKTFACNQGQSSNQSNWRNIQYHLSHPSKILVNFGHF